jgi:hypothetical protein
MWEIGRDKEEYSAVAAGSSSGAKPKVKGSATFGRSVYFILRGVMKK